MQSQKTSSNQLNEVEYQYAFCQLAQRAGFWDPTTRKDAFACAPINIIYSSDLELSNNETSDNSAIIYASKVGAFDQLINSPEKSIDWVKKEKLLPPGCKTSISDSIPILFPKRVIKNNDSFIHHNKNSVLIKFDIVAATFFMLSRYEEYRSVSRDKFGRFPAKESSAYRQGFLVQPIVDEYAMILRAWIKYLKPSWTPKTQLGKIKLTHDIDFVRTLPNLRKVGRMIFNESKSNSLPKAFNDVVHVWKNERNDPGSSIYVRAIHDLCQISKENGLDSTFFFKASPPSFYDSGYDIHQPVLKTLFRQILDQGSSIGLHPSYYSYKNAKQILRERDALESASGTRVTECRQHYLRFKVPNTWNYQIEAGFNTDNSLAYAEHVGFRCGTCHPYHPFDIAKQKELEIIERPLIVMDSSLKDYMRLSLTEAEDRILSLARLCINVEGEFSILWHNTSFFGPWFEWGILFRSILKILAK